MSKPSVLRWSTRGQFSNASLKSLFLLLPALLLANFTEINAQITCDSNPKTLRESGNDHSNGVSCEGKVEIKLEENTEIRTTSDSTDGITITNSQGINITSDAGTSITTTGTNSNGVSVYGSSGKHSYEIDVKDITITGNGGYGILVEPDQDTLGSSTIIKVENIKLTGTDGGSSDGINVSGIEVEGAGNIDISSTGRISTTANGVNGIFVNHYNPENSQGEDINIKVNDLSTSGDYASGIYVYSTELETSRVVETDVTISVEGTLETSGNTSQGIVVESKDSNITVDIESGGKVIAENTNTTTHALALLGTLGVGENNSATINNQGIVNGNIVTEGCAQFFNEGTTITQSFIIISSTDCPVEIPSGFFNSGKIDIGGDETKETAFTGKFVQKVNGEFIINVDWAKESSDLLVITGSADLSGDLVVNSVELPDFSTIEFERGVDFAGREVASQTFMTTTEGITGTLQYTSGSTLLLTNQVKKSDDNNELMLTLAFGNGLTLLNKNQTNVFWGLNSARALSSNLSDVFTDLFGIVKLVELQRTLDSFGNEIVGATIRAELTNIESFTLPMNYCEHKLNKQSNENVQNLNKGCTYFIAKSQRSEHSGDFEQRDHKDKLVEGLFRFPIMSDFVDGQLHLMGKFNETNINMANLAQSDGQSGSLALAYLQDSNIGTISLRAQVGLGSYKITRSLPVLDETLTARGTLKSRSADISAEISNSFDVGLGDIHWFVRAGYYGVKSKPYVETGGEDFALKVEESTTKTFVFNPRLKFVGNSWNLVLIDMAPILGVGLTHRTDPKVEFISQFNAGGDKILSTTALPETEYNYYIGADLWQPDNKLKGSLVYSEYSSTGEALEGEKISGQIALSF